MNGGGEDVRDYIRISYNRTQFVNAILSIDFPNI